MSRESLYPEIRRLREDEGLMWREIGERVGLALTTVQDYYTHPTAELDRARRDKYTGTCSGCGGRTNNGGAASGPPAICKACSQPEWTADSILLAFREWGDSHGGVPPRCVDARIDGNGHGTLPYESSVKRHFGSWNAGLLAAGFEALHCDRRPETQEAIETAIRSGERITAIADRYGVTVQAIYQRARYRGSRVSEMRSAA